MIYWSHVEQYLKNIKETYDEDEIIEFLRDCDMSDEQAHKFFDEFLKRKINIMNSFKDKAIGKLIDDFKIGRIANIKRGNTMNKKVASELIKIAKDLVGDFDFLNRDDTFRYQLLSRMKSDCEYYLGHGQRNPKRLWSGDVKSQIRDMKKLYESFDKKPEWITMKDILKYENEMSIK